MLNITILKKMDFINARCLRRFNKVQNQTTNQRYTGLFPKLLMTTCFASTEFSFALDFASSWMKTTCFPLTCVHLARVF